MTGLASVSADCGEAAFLSVRGIGLAGASPVDRSPRRSLQWRANHAAASHREAQLATSAPPDACIVPRPSISLPSHRRCEAHRTCPRRPVCGPAVRCACRAQSQATRLAEAAADRSSCPKPRAAFDRRCRFGCEFAGIRCRHTSRRDRAAQCAQQDRAIALVGAVARGDDTDDSDVDFVADFDKGVTLFDMCGLQAALEDLLGADVDVVPRSSVKRGCQRIFDDAIEL